MTDVAGARPRLSGTPDRSALVATLSLAGGDSERADRAARALGRFLPPERLLTGAAERLAYGYDATSERWLPDLVTLPLRTDEVVRIVQVAAELGLPVVARGSASGISGGAVPLAGGIVVAMGRMTAVSALWPERARAVCQPGVITLDLANRAAAYGLTYAPDPASYRISSLGGNIAENSGGPHCASQGVTTQHVERLRVVTADGRESWLPFTRDRADGVPDLSGAVVGSEGTLAVVTEIEVRLVPRPAGQDTLLAAFADMEKACAAVSAIVASGLVPSTLEVLDRTTIEVVERFAHAGYPEGAGAVLLVEVEGDEEARSHDAGRAAELLATAGALEVRLAKDQAERDRLWHGRRSSYGAMARLASHLWVQDVTVPRPLLAAMIRQVEEIAARHRLAIATVAHAGDGNLHPSIPYEPGDAEQYRHMKAADREILETCVAMGGSITGEHGIGIDKLEALPLMYSEAELAAMWAVKGALDPSGLLNPLKAVISPAQARAAGAAARVPPEPAPAEARVVEAVGRALDAGRRPLARGGGRRVALAGLGEATVDVGTLVEPEVRVDPENLTAWASASATPEMIAAAARAHALALRTPVSGRTLGGFLARDPFRPSRATGLSARDSLLAVTVVALDPPAVLRFGRATTKNVAGYDMPRLWSGSSGRLGPITSAVLRLWPAREDAVWRLDGEAVAVWRAAQDVLAAPFRPQLRALAATTDGGTPCALVRAEVGAARALEAMGWRPGGSAGDALSALDQAIEQGELAASSGEGAVLYAWNLEPGREADLFAAALALEGTHVWGLPGGRLALTASGSAPSVGVQAWAERVRATGGELAVSSAEAAWKALQPPLDPVWLDWTAGLEQALGTRPRTANREGVPG